MTYILSFIVAFGVAAIVGQVLIPLLRRLKAGQSIRADGPTWHMAKQGTPTMGGIMFIFGIVLSVVVSFLLMQLGGGGGASRSQPGGAADPGPVAAVLSNPLHPGQRKPPGPPKPYAPALLGGYDGIPIRRRFSSFPAPFSIKFRRVVIFFVFPST